MNKKPGFFWGVFIPAILCIAVSVLTTMAMRGWL